MKNISVCLIGEDSLLIQCGNIILAKNHTISLVISPISSIKEWAHSHQIPYINSCEELTKIKFFKVDYIFSVVNSHLLPSSFLQLARFYAINYHDSLLPKYAGLNATSWAIINNEKEHGISWHLMNEHIDEGDIISQVSFPILPNDSALTLNLRCYEHAIAAFAEMVRAIENNTLLFNKQDLAQKTYYSSSHHLPCFGFINWSTMPSEDIHRYYRALNPGQYSNYLGSLKLLLNHSYVIINEVKIKPVLTTSKATSGQILAIKHGLTVATLNSAVCITEFLSSTGEPLVLEDVINSNNLSIGDILPSFEYDDGIWRDLEKKARHNERYFIKELQQSVEHNVFVPKSIQVNTPLQLIPESISLAKIFPNKTFEDISSLFLTAILIYLYRLNDHEKITPMLAHSQYPIINQHPGQFFSSLIPFYFTQTDNASLQEEFEKIKNKHHSLEKKSSFFTDVFARHSVLKGHALDLSLVINLAENDLIYPISDNTLLYFHVNQYTGELRAYHRMNLGFQGGVLKEILKHMMQHLLNIIFKLINHAHLRARSFSFLTQVENNSLLRVWGRGRSRVLNEQPLAIQFEQQVLLNPQKIAIYDNGQTINYYALNEMANKIASYLQCYTFPKQSFIGIYLNRSIELMAVILGILKAGCVYVPLDMNYPFLKLKRIIEDTALTTLFIDRETPKSFRDFFSEQDKEINLLEVQSIFDKSLSDLIVPKEHTDSIDHLAYIMFTSGTTGRPKGVMVTHKNLINYCHWFTETTAFNSESIIDFSSSIAFDLSIPCTIAPLLVGGSLAIASLHQKANPKNYLTHLKQYKVTHVELTPGYVEMLLHYQEIIKQLTDLRYLLLGADVVPTREVQSWLSLCPWQQVVNEYGPTETTVSATSYFVRKDKLDDQTLVPIGRPGFNTTCYVLDKYRQLAPVGVKGELYIGGLQVAQGYLNRPELTEEKFVKINVGNDQERVYKTGDKVCWLPDGHLQFFGRNDNQVKIQGYRIELAEIETCLVRFPFIHQATVIVMTGQLNERYLRAYVVGDRKTLSSEKIIVFLAAHLPSYMIPREFCAVSAIPLKENEKIDFATLEKGSFELLSSKNFSSKHLQLNANEQIIKAIWEQVFHKYVVTINDNFFEQGGNSLMALQMVGELRKHYKGTIPLQILFEYPTIATLAQYLQQRNAAVALSSKPSLKCIIPLAQGQNKTPLFLIHPLGGSVFWYQPLAQLLKENYTIYGVQDPSMEENTHRFKTLEHMAQFYLDEIAKIYSGNEYYLGGASFGATVAFEMAQQLHHQGKQLKFLGLFDGWAHYPEKIMQETIWEKLTYAEKISLTKRQELEVLEEYRKKLLLNYTFKKLPSHATLFKAQQLWPEFKTIDDKKNGWSNYIDEYLNVYQIPGNHESMFFAPCVKYLAKAVSESLTLMFEHLIENHAID